MRSNYKDKLLCLLPFVYVASIQMANKSPADRCQITSNVFRICERAIQITL